MNQIFKTKCKKRCCSKCNLSVPNKPTNPASTNCKIEPGVVIGICYVKIFEARLKLEGESTGMANALGILANAGINLKAAQINYERCTNSYYMQIVTDNFAKSQELLNQFLEPGSNLEIISIKDGLRVTFAGGESPGLLAAAAAVIECQGLILMMATATPTPGELVIDTDNNRELYELLKPVDWPDNQYCWLG